MKATLRSPVELTEVSVLAEVAIWEPRPELQRLVREGEKQGQVGQEVVDAALPGLSPSAARNLLRTLEYLRLTDGKGAITPFGKRCAATGEAPAWELGVFTFLVARHPSFQVWPIGIRREQSDRQDRDFANLDQVPTWFTPNPNRLWISAFDDKTKFTISAFPAPAGQSPAVRMRELAPVTLVWSADLSSGKNQLHVEGTVENSGPFRTTDQKIAETEVAAFYSQWESRWNSADGRLLMAFDGKISAGGADDFVRTLKYKRVKTEKRGLFDSVSVDGVPVGPESGEQARVWASAMASARLTADDAYRTSTAWRSAWDQMVLGTPLEGQAGPAPQPLDFVKQSPPMPPRTRWLLAAPTDLSMEK